VLQLNRQAELDVALLVVVAELAGGVPGTMQADWHADALELQVIMQVVTAEVCARRILPAAAASAAAATHPLIASAARRIVIVRMTGSAAIAPIFSIIAQ